jgi:hypothetical protein
MSESNPQDGLVPRGESRPASDSLTYGYDADGSPEAGGKRRNTRSTLQEGPDDSELTETEAHQPPKFIQSDYNEYYLEFPFVQAALKIFEDEVVEPGWHVEATVDGETDEEMTEALELWGQNCAIHGGEPGNDIRKLINSIPSKRRAKPGVFLEKVGTADDPDTFAALQLLDPKTLEIYTHKNKNLIVQPGDDVPAEHPTTEDGTPAGYVQYPGSSTAHSRLDRDQEPIAFSAEDIVKIAYDPPENSPWGRTIWPAIRYHIESLKQKLRDQHASIALAGHPHRLYIGKNWQPEHAKALAQADRDEETSGGNTRSRSPSRRRGSRRRQRRREREDYGKVNSQAGRVDYLPGNQGDVEVEVVDGTVADIDDAVMYDIEAIFSILPISKFKLAFEEGINQFVVEPQERKDDRYVDDERLEIRETIEPLFEQKADELAGGDYQGEVEWKLEQPKADNPFERSDFDADAVATLVGAFANYAQSDADTVFGAELPYLLADMDQEEFQSALDASPFAPDDDEEMPGVEGEPPDNVEE